MISAEKLKRTYVMGEVEVPALKEIDLHIKSGEFVSIMGPSGSGKSTLLHLLGVLDRQTTGTIKINGTDVAALTEEERTKFRLHHIGFVFQFYSLLPELTAVENVFVPKLLQGETIPHAREHALKLLDLIELKDRANHYPHQLSGGQQQRVAIARALINQPKILLADEPTASLDSVTARKVIETFKRLNEERKQTIIMITHEQALGQHAQRGIWLKDGEIDKEKSF